MTSQPESTPGRPEIIAVLFDMDGLLINSEDLYTQISNELLEPYGKRLDWELKSQLMGKPALDSASHLIRTTGIPMTPEEWISKMGSRQLELFPTVEPLPGAVELVQHLYKQGVRIAIATGSKQKNFILKSSHLPSLFSPFPPTSIITGDSPLLPPGRGKPHPDIFEIAARTLDLDVDGPEKAEVRKRILVFEDGLPGVKAAKAAGMSVIWVPDPALLDLTSSSSLPSHTSVQGSSADQVVGTEDPGADQTLRSLSDFKPEEWGLPPFTAA